MIMYKRVNMTTLCKLNINSTYNCKRYMLSTSEVTINIHYKVYQDVYKKGNIKLT